MNRHTPAARSLALAALLVAVLGLAACGSDDDGGGTGSAGAGSGEATLPPGAVAKVGDKTITRGEYGSSLATTGRHEQAQAITPKGIGGGGPVVVMDPPRFTKCMAAYRAGNRLLPSDLRSDPGLKNVEQRCRKQYAMDHAQALSTLIQATRVEQDAAEEGIKATPAEIQKELALERNLDKARRIASNFRGRELSDAELEQQFLATRGGRAKAVQAAKVQVLQDKLLDHAIAEKARVTDDDVSAFYDRNAKRFARPQRRDLLIVVTKTKAQADRAKALLEAGASFPSVQKRLKAQGGTYSFERGKQEPELEDAVFNAAPNVISGPIKTRPGWVVFAVTRATPASRTPLAQVGETIRDELRRRRVQQAITAYYRGFLRRTKQQTTCAGGFTGTELCGNSPVAR